MPTPRAGRTPAAPPASAWSLRRSPPRSPQWTLRAARARPAPSRQSRAYDLLSCPFRGPRSAAEGLCGASILDLPHRAPAAASDTRPARPLRCAQSTRAVRPRPLENQSNEIDIAIRSRVDFRTQRSTSWPSRPAHAVEGRALRPRRPNPRPPRCCDQRQPPRGHHRFVRAPPPPKPRQTSRRGSPAAASAKALTVIGSSPRYRPSKFVTRFAPSAPLSSQTPSEEPTCTADVL